MKPSLYYARRFLRGGILESGLVIVGLALAAAVFAGSLALFFSFEGSVSALREAPSYRELTVSIVNDNGGTSAAAQKVDATQRRQNLNPSDIAAFLKNSQSVNNGYVADFQKLPLGVANSFGGFGGGQVGFAAPAVGATTGTTGSGTAATSSSSTASASAKTSGTSSTTTPSATGGAVFMDLGGGPPDGGGDFGGPPQDLGAAQSTTDSASTKAASATASNKASAASSTSSTTQSNRQGRTTQSAQTSPSAQGDNGPPDLAAMQQQLEALQKEAATLEKPLLDEAQTARITPEFFAAYGLNTVEGSLFTTQDETAGNAVAVVGAGIATKLFSDGKSLSKRILIRGRIYTIIGVLGVDPWAAYGTSVSKRKIDDMIFLPESAGIFNFARDNNRFQFADSLIFSVATSSELESAKNELMAYFTGVYGEGKIQIDNALDQLERDKVRQDTVLGVVGILALMGMIIASVNLYNLMMSKVLRRSKSTGIQRSYGASRTAIFRQFLVEAGLLTSIGTIIAFPLAFAVTSVLQNMVSTRIAANMGIGLLVVSVLIAGLLGSLIAFVPARRAASLSMAEALKS